MEPIEFISQDQMVARIQWYYDLMLQYKDAVIDGEMDTVRLNLLDEMIKYYEEAFRLILYKD